MIKEYQVDEEIIHYMLSKSDYTREDIGRVSVINIKIDEYDSDFTILLESNIFFDMSDSNKYAIVLSRRFYETYMLDKKINQILNERNT